MGTLWRLFFASAAKRARYGLFAVVLERIKQTIRCNTIPIIFIQNKPDRAYFRNIFEKQSG